MLKPLILSSSIIPEDETSENQVNAIMLKVRDILPYQYYNIKTCILNIYFYNPKLNPNNKKSKTKKLKSCGKRLDQWADILKREFPNCKHKIPSGKEMNIGKLGNGGAITTDMCNGAQKTRRLLVEEVIRHSINNNVLQVDCWHHLRYVWLEGMGKSLTTFLNNLLKDSLDEIDPRLRVTPGMEGILRACDKEFSLCANYPKGHGELFNTWTKEHHPGALLLHVERATGSRNDLIVEGSGAVYWNRQYWVEFLDDRLRIPGDNILQENLFVVLSSLEIVALSRVYSIVHLAICLPVR